MKQIKFITVVVIFGIFLVPTVFVFAQCTPGTLCNPFSGGNSLIDFINTVISNIVLPIGAVVSVFFLIYSGFLFVTAQGSEDKLKTAKTTLLYTIIGIAILLGALVISAAIKGTLCQIAPSTPGLCT